MNTGMETVSQVDMLEKIQWRASILMSGLRDFSYEERLRECGLTTPEARRLRGIKYKLFFIISDGHGNINPNIYFLNKTRKITRGHDFTLVVVRLEQR